MYTARVARVKSLKWKTEKLGGAVGHARRARAMTECRGMAISPPRPPDTAFGSPTRGTFPSSAAVRFAGVMLALARHQRLNAALWGFVRSPRPYQTARVSIVGDNDPPPREEEDYETKRRRKTEWKRRQNVRAQSVPSQADVLTIFQGQTFKDHLMINVRGGGRGFCERVVRSQRVFRSRRRRLCRVPP